MGIEPTRPAWKAGILPLNYTRVVFASRHLKSLSIDSFIIIAHSKGFVNRKTQNFSNFSKKSERVESRRQHAKEMSKNL